MVQEDNRLRRRIRSSYFISTVSIAMVLFLLGSSAYVIFNVLDATDRLRESVTVYVMLKDGLPVEQKTNLHEQIATHEAVREVVYVSKEEAAEKFIAETGEDFTDFLGDDPDANPLPDSFEVGFGANASEKELIGDFAAALEAMPGVDEVVYQRGVVEQIGANLGKLNLAALLFGGALLVISLILLNNTIRMTIIAKHRIINTMKLVGANRGFIMRPFLVSAVLHGLYAGLISAAMFVLLLLGLREGVPEIGLIAGNALPGAIAGGMLLCGVVISLLFTVPAVGKATRQDSSKALM